MGGLLEPKDLHRQQSGGAKGDDLEHGDVQRARTRLDLRTTTDQGNIPGKPGVAGIPVRYPGQSLVDQFVILYHMDHNYMDNIISWAYD